MQECWVLAVGSSIMIVDDVVCGGREIESNDFTSEIVRVRINNNASVGTHL